MSSHFFIYLTCVLVILGAGGCSNARPFDYHSQNEIPSGPGLLSGTQGDFSLTQVPKDEEVTGDAARRVSQPAVHADPPEHEAQDTLGSYREFREWKSRPENREAYEEFLRWLEWLQFQKWKNSTE